MNYILMLHFDPYGVCGIADHTRKWGVHPSRVPRKVQLHAKGVVYHVRPSFEMTPNPDEVVNLNPHV